MSEAKSPNPTKIQPNVFEYEDVGSFLNDWLIYLKTHKKLSLRQITKEAQISIGYLSMVLNGKRRLTEKSMQKLLVHLRLGTQERRFLELLHTIGESDSALLRVEALFEMSKLASFRKANQKEHDTYKYLTKWYYAAIREMTLLPDFKEDPLWIQGRLRGKIGLHEITEAISFLESRGFVVRNEQNKLTIPEINLQCKEGIYKISLGEFHRQVLEIAHNSIHEVARDQRYILGRTVAISKSEFEQAKEIFDEALKKIEALGQGNETSKEVYQFELAAFPLTEEKGNLK
ncbi:MAG: DUF4423 domain-containing protein [Pseudobdellovibrionaceae bacterium]